MYNFELLDGEEIIMISNDTFVRIEDKSKNISSILTNKRLLLLDYPLPFSDYKEVLRIGRGASYMKMKEVILEVQFSDIIGIFDEDGFDRYFLSDTNYFYLKDDKLRDKINEIKAKQRENLDPCWL